MVAVLLWSSALLLKSACCEEEGSSRSLRLSLACLDIMLSIILKSLELPPPPPTDEALSLSTFEAEGSSIARFACLDILSSQEPPPPADEARDPTKEVLP